MNNETKPFLPPANPTEDDTPALVQREYRRRAFGLDCMCDWDFAHDNGQNPPLTEVGKNYVTHYKLMKENGMGIMYFGAIGSGKSYAAAQITNALTDAGYDCLFTSFRKILTDLGTLSNEGKQDYLNRLFKKDLIVFDECGGEGVSTYYDQIILHIISECYRRRIPMLVTTCYHRDSLVKTGSSMRLLALSRLWQRCCCMQVNTPASRRHVTQDQLTREEELLKGPEPYNPEPAEYYTEPCQAEREAVLQKELEEKEAKRKQKRKQKTKSAQSQADGGTEQEETDHAGTSTPAKH